MAESISTPIADNPAKVAAAESSTKPKSRRLFRFARRSSKSESRKLYEEAVENAQYVMAYASSKCKKEIDKDTVEKLIVAKRRIENNEAVDPQEEAEFWIAYQDLWNLVRPLTAECIRATEGPKARKTMYWHIGFTFSVLFVLLILQIYWVIGNQLTTRLADLLKQETELSEKIRANQDEYNTIEVRFKENEKNSENFQGVYAYPFSPEFERDTAENLAEKAKLEAESEALKSQLERNSTILISWSRAWNRSNEATTNSERLNELAIKIQSTTDSINDIRNQLKLDQNGQSKIEESQSNVDNLVREIENLKSDPEGNAAAIADKNSKLEKAYSELYYFNQLSDQLKGLESQKATLNLQKESQSIQETSRRAQLVALFVLIILQSYLLPLLYGLLGASTSSLRSLSREIDQVIFSDKRRIQHMLRIALGALSGIMVGWFSFLYEGTTLLGSVPPLAIAFLVGYNIELFFSLMDRGIAAVKRAGRTPDEDASTQASADRGKDKAKKDEKPGSPEEASAPVG